MKQRHIWSGCLTLAGVLVFFLLTRGSQIDRERFEMLRVGMPRQEVEQILGGPARNEFRNPITVWVRRESGLVSAELRSGGPAVQAFPDPAKATQEALWAGKSGFIAARFGDDGRLQEKHFSDVHVPEGPPGLLGAVVRMFW